MVAYGWEMVAQIWAISLLLMALIFWFLSKDEPDLVARLWRATQEAAPDVPVTIKSRIGVDDLDIEACRVR